MAKVSRNARCPKCGQKMKRCECKSTSSKITDKLSIIMAVVGLIAVSVIIVHVSGMEKKEAGNPVISETDAYLMKYSKVAKSFFHKNNRPDTWWLEKSPRNAGNKTEWNKILKEFDKKAQEIKNIFARYKNISPLANRIGEMFVELMVNFLHGSGIRAMSSTIKDGNQMLVTLGQICFVPKDQLGGRYWTTAHYDSQGRSVLILGTEWTSEPLFAGLLFHEAGHALYHLVDKRKSSIAPTNSDTFISEEVDMHILEDKIVDASTDGRFVQYIEEFITQNSSAGSYEELISLVTEDDMEKISRILGCQSMCTKAEVSIMSTVIEFSLGYHYIIRDNNNQVQIKKQLIELYRKMTKK